MICANTRTPEVTWGDISAQINTNTYGLTEFAELFGKHGIDKVLACWQGLDGHLRAASCARKSPRCRMASTAPRRLARR